MGGSCGELLQFRLMLLGNSHALGACGALTDVLGHTVTFRTPSELQIIDLIKLNPEIAAVTAEGAALIFVAGAACAAPCGVAWRFIVLDLVGVCMDPGGHVDIGRVAVGTRQDCSPVVVSVDGHWSGLPLGFLQ